MKPVTAVLIGAGQRGRFVYGRYAESNPARLRFVAVAEPDEGRRLGFATTHRIGEGDRSADWRDLLNRPAIADVCVVATNDRDHIGPVLAALRAGYHVLLEKPMAADLATTMEVHAAAEMAAASEQVVHVAHVLRYTRFFQALHAIVGSGRLGELITVEHRENVAFWHMAHTFVRGRASRRLESSPMILQKSCHDFDILQWVLPDPVEVLASVGSLKHFRPDRAPDGATDRCTDPCPAAPTCPFDARRVYLDMSVTGFPVHVVTEDLSYEGRVRALERGPYGRCVYLNESDVVDHQATLMRTTGGTSVVFTMHGHSGEEGRTMRYDGARATLRGRFGRAQEIEIYDHVTRQVETLNPAGSGGHGGGDEGSIEAFLDAASGRRPSPTIASASLESHLLAFAAEAARLSESFVDMPDFRRAAHAITGERDSPVAPHT